MTSQEGEPVVALALVRPASGRTLAPGTRVTAENVADYAPDPGVAGDLQAELRDTGFEVGPLVGVGMAVSGPRELFERFFGTTVQRLPDGSWMSVEPDGRRARELPLSAVPERCRRALLAVTFEPPAEPVQGEWP